MADQHLWRFYRAGGFDQVRLDSGADLAALDQLDQKLWVALSCPVKGLEFDEQTLQAIDADGDGRIRAPDVIAAVKWACGCLTNPDDLLRGAAELPLMAITAATPEGQRLRDSARHILTMVGKPEALAIGPAETQAVAASLEQTTLNGDGIVPADAAADPALQQLIVDVIACCGSRPDRSGKPGVDQSLVTTFFTAARAHDEWWRRAEGDAVRLPLGERTKAAADAALAVTAKIEDFFARCRLAAFDARAIAALNREEKEYLALAAKDLTITDDEITSLPLARIAAGAALPVAVGVNPAWIDRLAALHAAAVEPLLGATRTELSEEDWRALGARLAPYREWQQSKVGGVVEPLGLPRLRAILGGNGEDELGKLIAADLALQPQFDAISAVDKLVRYHRDLYKLLMNFVSFRDFYARRDKASFQAGTLYLDGRSCELCIRVEDIAQHAALAALSRVYLAYCALKRKGTTETMTIAAAFTDGDADNLMVGRNGVFYDRQGRDWDATITRIVEQPISIRQAFWSPYKKVSKLVEEQIEKFAASKEKAVHEASAVQVAQAVVGVPVVSSPPGAAAKPIAAGTPAAAGAAAPPAAADAKKAPFDVAKFAGIFAAIGLAIGAIGGALGAMVAAFSNLAWWQMPLALGGIMLAVSGPSMILAALKLRQRNLGPLLDGNGWAVNAKAKINISFGRTLTGVARLPPGAQRNLRDPYAEQHRGRTLALVLLLLAAACWSAWNFGLLERLLPGLLPRSGWVERHEQSADPPTPAPTPVPKK